MKSTLRGTKREVPSRKFIERHSIHSHCHTQIHKDVEIIKMMNVFLISAIWERYQNSIE